MKKVLILFAITILTAVVVCFGVSRESKAYQLNTVPFADDIYTFVIPMFARDSTILDSYTSFYGDFLDFASELDIIIRFYAYSNINHTSSTYSEFYLSIDSTNVDNNFYICDMVSADISLSPNGTYHCLFFTFKFSLNYLVESFKEKTFFENFSFSRDFISLGVTNWFYDDTSLSYNFNLLDLDSLNDSQKFINFSPTYSGWVNQNIKVYDCDSDDFIEYFVPTTFNNLTYSIDSVDFQNFLDYLSAYLGYYENNSSDIVYNYAYQQGYDSGYSAGRLVGDGQGYDLGYQNGYSQGVLDNTNIPVLLLSLADIPFSVFSQIWNFEIFGLNIYYLVVSLISLAILLWIIKNQI